MNLGSILIVTLIWSNHAMYSYSLGTFPYEAQCEETKEQVTAFHPDFLTVELECMDSLYPNKGFYGDPKWQVSTIKVNPGGKSWEPVGTGPADNEKQCVDWSQRRHESDLGPMEVQICYPRKWFL